MKKPIISIVVPVYNLKELLPRCMKSLLDQSFSSYQILLIDDGSTDGSGELCEQYQNKFPDIVQCIHKENGGLSSARNVGMEKAEGEFVIFPDPDDWVESDYLMKLYDLQKNYETDLVCTGYWIETGDHTQPVNDNVESRVLTGKDVRVSLLVPPCMNGFAWNKLYNLNVIRKYSLTFLNDVGTTEDLDFAYRYLQHCESVYYAPSILTYHYYQRPGAATHSGYSRRKIDSIHTFEKIIEAETDKLLIEAAKVEICNWALNLMQMYFASNINDSIDFGIINNYFRENIYSYLNKNLLNF